MGGAGGRQGKHPGWVFGLELEGLMDSSQAEGGGAGERGGRART